MQTLFAGVRLTPQCCLRNGLTYQFIIEMASLKEEPAA
jgi:hypothetical protein